MAWVACVISMSVSVQTGRVLPRLYDCAHFVTMCVNVDTQCSINANPVRVYFDYIRSLRLMREVVFRAIHRTNLEKYDF